MLIPNFKFYLVCYLAVLILVLAFSIKFRDRFWRVLSAVYPLILIAYLLFNGLTFRLINQNHIHPAYQGHLERLPTNELIDLFITSTSPSRASWIYLLVEDYYQGRVLWIPENALDSLELSPERLQTQGRLARVEIRDLDDGLSDDEIARILDLEFTMIDNKSGLTYHFILQESDPDSPLLLLKEGNRLFFIPQDLLPEGEK